MSIKERLRNIDINIGYWVLVGVLALVVAHLIEVNNGLTYALIECYNATTTYIPNNITWQW